MVNAFSDYARAPEINFAPLNLNGLVREVADLYHGPQQPELRLDLDPGLITVDADAVRLRQLLHNLIRNACEALEGQAGGRLIVGTQRLGRSGNCAGVAGAAVEAFEDFLGLAVREPFALVGHLELDGTTGLHRADRDRRAGRGVLLPAFSIDLAQRAPDRARRSTWISGRSSATSTARTRRLPSGPLALARERRADDVLGVDPRRRAAGMPSLLMRVASSKFWMWPFRRSASLAHDANQA